MSLIPTGVGLIQAGAQGLLETAFFQTRSIGGLVADITVEEVHNDEIRITDHPVERNVVISDHAYKLPERVNITVGYSNSSPQAAGNPNYIREMYEQFRALQVSFELIYILTGKRLYQNMLIERLSTTTDEKTENALILRLECREIIIADTQVTQMAPAQDQTTPQSTTGIQNQGTVAVAPPTNVNQTAADATFLSSGGYTPGSASVGSLGTQQFDSTKTVEVPIVSQANVSDPFSTLGAQVP